jgi:DNA primase small subunit
MNETQKLPPTTNLSAVTEASTVQNLLLSYYNHFFPFELMTKWLSYGSEQRFARREFSFTTRLPNGNEIYHRYQSFQNAAEWRRAVTHTHKENPPFRIDIGAVYNTSPAERLTTMVAEEKELVFDIDMTDYDSVRHYCDCKATERAACERCWQVMVTAMKVLDHVLTHDFGFDEGAILWVYSGRRGVHCWVGDPRARRLSVEARQAIGQYLTLINDQKPVALRPSLPPTLQWAYSHVLYPHFTTLVNKMNLFDNANACDTAIALVHEFDAKLAANLKSEWNMSTEHATTTRPITSVDKWSQLCQSVETCIQQKARGNVRVDPIKALVFTYTWPRLDIEVTKQMTHLLKSPWIVHPATGRLCVPIDRRNFDKFNPDTVPTLQQLQMGELTDSILQPFKETFERFVLCVTELQTRTDTVISGLSSKMPSRSSVADTSQKSTTQTSAQSLDW